MPKRTPKIGKSTKQPKQAEDTDWNFSELLNTNIKDLEIGNSLRRLGKIQVTEWELKSVVPAVKKIADIEIDVIGGIKKAASYKVMEWDYKSPKHSVDSTSPKPRAKASKKKRDVSEMQELIEHLKSFLQYVAFNLIEQPSNAQIKAMEIAPRVLRLRLVLVKRDVAMLIGREGHTAAAIRSILKAAGRKCGVEVLLQILSHEEELALSIRDA